MPRRLPNYVRAARKEAGLSQGELAFLLGCRNGSKVSRYERFTRQPNVLTVFACAIIFQVAPENLFAGLYAAAHSAVAARAAELLRQLEGAKLDRRTSRKIPHLQTILARAPGVDISV